MRAWGPYGHHRLMTDPRNATIALRPATSADDRVLDELAQLDSARPLARPALLAVVDDAPVAAISIADGRVVADPFVPSESVVELLRARAGRGATARRGRRLHLRAA